MDKVMPMASFDVKRPSQQGAYTHAEPAGGIARHGCFHLSARAEVAGLR
jgi:hypothetical protein